MEKANSGTYNGLNRAVKLGAYGFAILVGGVCCAFVLIMHNVQANECTKNANHIEKIQDKIEENQKEVIAMLTDIKIKLAKLEKDG